MTAPAVVLAHGLGHGAWCWDAVRGELTGRGVDELVFVAAFPLEGGESVSRTRSTGGACPRPPPSVRRTGWYTPSGSAPWPPAPTGS